MHEDLNEGNLLEPLTNFCPWGERIIYQNLSLVKGGKKGSKRSLSNSYIVSLTSILGKKFNEKRSD